MLKCRNICLFVLLAIAKGIRIDRVAVDFHNNISLPCNASHGEDIIWVQRPRGGKQVPHMTIEPDGSLLLFDVNRNDSGVYECFIQNDDEEVVISKINLTIRTPPLALRDVTIYPSTILALINWKVGDNGGYPVIDFTAQYRLAFNDSLEWIPISPNHISPNVRQIDVYKLEPNTTYSFRIWATNQLGPGEITEVESTTRHQTEAIELERNLLRDAQNFDTRTWIIAVAVVMGTLVILSVGTCYLLYVECRSPGELSDDDQEIIELVPNIILNPGFEGNFRTERIPADENSNNETTLRLNNNTVVQPRNV